MNKKGGGRDPGEEGLMVHSVKYEISEDPFAIPIKFKKEVPLNKNIFQLNEPLPKNYGITLPGNTVESQQLHDPLSMNSASMKYLLIQKMIAYLSVFSILISIYELYWIAENDLEALQYVRWLNVGGTVLLLVMVCVGMYFHYQNNVEKRVSNKVFAVVGLVKIIVVLMIPNPWLASQLKFMHLPVLLRLYFPLIYMIIASKYYDPRAARITNIYGIKPELTFKFAHKVIRNQQNVVDVLFIYFSVVMFYSHCLFIVSDNLNFMECFQVVVATLPTIGFGQYQIKGIPRVIIACIMATGVLLNAFVTFVILKQFQMTTSQNNSFILMQKLKVVEQLETLSSSFIIRKIMNKKGRLNFLQQKINDQSFKNNYSQFKTRYRSLNPPDSIYQFNYFKEMLNDLRVKMGQTNNMVNVLLARLAAERRMQRKEFKALDIQD